jgi:glucose-6-phosphate isomerase, archaeal
MPATTDPFLLQLDAESGYLAPHTSVVTRRLSHMRGMYGDGEAERRLIDDGDPLVYEVTQYDVPPQTGELFVCTTVLYPGRVGDEFFMTKGHYHAQRDRAEVYYGIRGHGWLVLQRDDRIEAVPMGPGAVGYVPPYWAHRTVNVGEEPFVFLAVYPGDAGHDYATIESDGFLQRVVDDAGEPVLR